MESVFPNEPFGFGNLYLCWWISKHRPNKGHRSMRFLKICLCAAVLACVTSTTFARPRSLLELTTNDKTYRGKVVCSDDETCWLMARDGRLQKVNLKSVEKYRVVEPNFRPFRAAGRLQISPSQRGC